MPIVSASAPLDIAFVRRQFPSLDGDSVFLDNAGGSQALGRVIDRIADYLRTTNVQLGASYAISERAGERMQEAQRRMAAFINAGRPEEVVMGPTSTLLVQLLARAMGHQFAPGDELVISRADHESNIGAWVGLESIGVVPRLWELDRRSQRLELDSLERVMSPRTKLVAFTHASNIFGTIHPVAEIARFVHIGARWSASTASPTPRTGRGRPRLGRRLLRFSLYKVFGPHQGLLYGRRDLLLDLANVTTSSSPRTPCPTSSPATSITSWRTACRHRRVPGGARRARRAARPPPRADQAPSRHRRSRGGLARRRCWITSPPSHASASSVRPLADRSGRVADHQPSRSTAEPRRDLRPRSTRCRIGIRSGDFHSRRLVDDWACGAGGIVRVSMVHYNTPRRSTG